MIEIEEVSSLAHGVGGSYTVWQRKPPPHAVYKVETPKGYGVVQVHAEVKIGDDEPSIPRIKNDSNHFSEIEFSEEELEEVEEYILEEVLPEDKFFEFNRDEADKDE